MKMNKMNFVNIKITVGISESGDGVMNRCVC